MVLDNLLWKIPCYRRKKVIGIVDSGEEALIGLPIYEHHNYFRNDTFRGGMDDKRNYVIQTELLRIFNKYQLAEQFMKEFPDLTDERVIALIGNLYRDYVAGNMWADGVNPDPLATKDKLHRRIDVWAELLSGVDPIISNTFRDAALRYEEQVLK